MNYGGDAADQIVRYSMEGMEHTLRISGSIAKNLAVLIVAVMKDQKKTRGKTNLLCRITAIVHTLSPPYRPFHSPYVYLFQKKARCV